MFDPRSEFVRYLNIDNELRVMEYIPIDKDQYVYRRLGKERWRMAHNSRALMDTSNFLIYTAESIEEAMEIEVKKALLGNYDFLSDMGKDSNGN